METGRRYPELGCYTHNDLLKPNLRFLSAVIFVLAAGVANAAPAIQLTSLHHIPFVTAVVASQDDRRFDIRWNAPGIRHVDIYAGTDPAHIALQHPVAGGGGATRVTVSGLQPAPRWYFELVPDRGQPLVLAERSLHLAGAGNFRDIGGYRTQSGQWVRMDLAYRSNELDKLTPTDLATLTALKVNLICDLRTDGERRHGADLVPAGVPDIPADVLADDAAKLRAIMTAKPSASPGQDPSAVSQAIYRDFVGIDSARHAYHLLFERLADPSQLPTVFHCSAGKDRTGWADAVLLTLLGVPHATIVADYVLTNTYLQGADLQHLRAQFQANSLASRALTADPADLEAAFAEVTRRYGSFDQYLHTGLGLTDATISAIHANFLAG